ncbi:MAG: polysaccharide deacetylase family protein [Planctomycetota bacterium]|jgi:peptidoglycan/xylan/chitin deacetylase (PgdA/CDA1 family)
MKRHNNVTDERIRMKNARIVVVVLFCFAAGLTGCCSLCPNRCVRAKELAKPDQISPATERKKMHLETSSAGPDDFSWPKGKRAAISLSFDDARLSQVDRGLQILDACGVKATFYVVPSRVEQRLSGWKKAVANGHEIGNHTVRHPCTGNFPRSREKALEQYCLEDVERELDEASTAIERLLGVRPTTFAYPCGQKFVGRGLSVKSYVPLVAERFIVGRGAYDEVANDPAFCDLAQVTGIDLDGLDFEQVKQIVDEAAADGRWLVFFGHEVGEPARQTAFASTLEALCRYAQEPANGLWIDTVAAVGEYILEQRAGSK